MQCHKSITSHLRTAACEDVLVLGSAAGRPALQQQLAYHQWSRPAARRPQSHCVVAAASLQGLVSKALQPAPGLAAGVLVNSTVYLLGFSVLLQGLTPAGVLHSWVLGTVVYSAFGYGGYAIVCLYFLLGSAATMVKLKQKQAEGIAEERSGRRSIGSVWGSGLAGMLCAVAAMLTRHHNLWRVGFVASFVSKFSDTVSSEIGKAYGKTTYLSTTFRRVPRGTEGAVSLEGTAAGFAAAALFSGLALAFQQLDLSQARLVALAAILANLFESVLGALIQGKESTKWLTNDIVNMMQICLAAYLAMIFIDI